MGILDRIFQSNPYKKNPLLASELLDNGSNLIGYGYQPDDYVNEFIQYYDEYRHFNLMLLKHTAWSIDILLDHHGLK